MPRISLSDNSASRVCNTPRKRACFLPLRIRRNVSTLLFAAPPLLSLSLSQPFAFFFSLRRQMLLTALTLMRSWFPPLLASRLFPSLLPPPPRQSIFLEKDEIALHGRFIRPSEEKPWILYIRRLLLLLWRSWRSFVAPISRSKLPHKNRGFQTKRLYLMRCTCMRYTKGSNIKILKINKSCPKFQKSLIMYIRPN